MSSSPLWEELAPKVILFPGGWNLPSNFIEIIESEGEWLEPDGYGQTDEDENPVAAFKFFNEGEIPEDVYPSFDSAMRRVCNSYSKITGSNFEAEGSSSMEVKKYYINGFYEAHVNNDEDDDHESLIVVMMFPNDDYDGGEVVITDYDVMYKPKKGDVLMFPATYLNESLPATKSNKYEILQHIAL